MTTGPAGVPIELLTAPTAAERDDIIALESSSFSNPWTAETFDQMMTVPVARLYVARPPGGRIVAFCACWLIEDELHINTVAVAAAWRRRGLGSTLVRDVLRRTGVSRATLEVRESNVAARALYEGLGFKVTAIRQRYYENPEENALILWLNP